MTITPLPRTSRPTPTPGSASGGEALFPLMGNGGYDADHYSVELDVDVNRNFFNAAKTTMDAKATQDLSSFNLDFRGFDIGLITVNGQEAQFSRDKGELTVVPQEAILNGQNFKVAVEYSGAPQPVESQSAPVTIGWNGFPGGAYVVSEPEGSPGWYPCNDIPSDKATYDFKVTVDKGFTVAANGVLESQRDQGEKTTFQFAAHDPMASYLTTMHIGNYTRVEDVGPHGLPIRHYFPSDMVEEGKYDFARTPEMIQFLETKYGPYPFENYGVVVIDTQIGGAALETQTLPLYERDMVSGDRRNEWIWAHELGHQWWGDSVSLKQWKDVWLNEGSATYAEWLWLEKEKGPDALRERAQDTHDSLARSGAVNMASPDNAMGLEEMRRKHRPIGEPNATGLFAQRVYEQGGLTMHALRLTVGDEDFFKTLQTFQERFHGKSADTADFQMVAEEVSGQDLNKFFQDWLHSDHVPDLPPQSK